MITAGIIGSTGYAGGEIVRLLLQREDISIKWYGSQSYIDKKYSDVFGNMVQFTQSLCQADDITKLADEVDVIFMATPQGYCASVISEEILQKTKVIDLSADFRMKDVSTLFWFIFLSCSSHARKS